MLLWQIKANALRLMFADSDMNFNEEEFEDKIVYQNSNTREKLVLMDDSIRRALDLYYQFNGGFLAINTFEHEGRIINLADETWFGYPTRIDAEIYQIQDDKKVVVRVIEKVSFFWNEFDKMVVLDNEITGNVDYRIWYKTAEKNLPFDALDMSYNLDEIKIPEDVQRMIPYFIKGELYEEDEPNVAVAAKNEYIYFIRGLRSKQGKVQTKVKSSPVFKRKG